MADTPIYAATTAGGLIPPLHVFVAPLGEVKQLCVDARLLHQCLRVNLIFSQWLKSRIQKYKFQENLDWQCFPQDSRNSNVNPEDVFAEEQPERRTGRPYKNYLISLEMAKALSLIENNSDSYEVWRALIKKEKFFIEALGIDNKSLQRDEYQRITTAQAQKLKEIVNECARKTQQHHQTIWTQFQYHFRVNSYLELPSENFERACSYLNSFLESRMAKEIAEEKKLTDLERDIQEKILSIANHVIISVRDVLRKNQPPIEKITTQAS